MGNCLSLKSDKKLEQQINGGSSEHVKSQHDPQSAESSNHDDLKKDSSSDQADQTTSTYDLIIVGAGPTGLFSALLARQLGLKVCILDAKPGPIEVGGADAITARTQQYLEVFDNLRSQCGQKLLLNDLSNKGIRCNTSTTYADGGITSRQSHWWTTLPHTFHASFLMIGQPYIESLFSSTLDIPIHYSEPVDSFTYTTSSVTVTTSKRTASGRYLIAADGARSFIRQSLGIQRTGTKPNMIWTVLDCWVKTDYPLAKEIVACQINGESRLAWIPRERGMQRFYLLLDGESTLENAEKSIKKHLAPKTIDVTHVEWLSTFEVKERVANEFLFPSRDAGPIILAGDAAHVHAVNGGQGMNTGLSDAFSLIWRLNLLLKCSVPSSPLLSPSTQSSLLSTYALERHSTAQSVINVASQLVRATQSSASDYVKLIEKNAGYITGMGVSYAGLGSELVVDGQRGIWKGGERVPDVWLEGDGEGNGRGGLRLYEVLEYGKYMLLIIGGGSGGEMGNGEVRESEFLKVIRVRALVARSVGVEGREGARGIDGIKGEAYGCAEVEDGDEFAVLARPDCYIEHVGTVAEVVERLRSRLPAMLA